MIRQIILKASLYNKMISIYLGKKGSRIRDVNNHTTMQIATSMWSNYFN